MSVDYAIAPAVLNALASERVYQDKIAVQFQHKGKPSLEAELLLVSEYARLSVEACVVVATCAHKKETPRRSNGGTGAPTAVRRAARCFENHGVEPRK